MNAAPVQPRPRAFIAVELGAIGGHQLTLQSSHKVTYMVTSTKKAVFSDPLGSPKTASDLRFYRLRRVGLTGFEPATP